MNAKDIIAALELPAEALVNQRVPKKLLVESDAPTAADRRQINDHMEALFWVAALKPATIGVPLYRDEKREYLEIAVLHLSCAPAAELLIRIKKPVGGRRHVFGDTDPGKAMLDIGLDNLGKGILGMIAELSTMAAMDGNKFEVTR